MTLDHEQREKLRILRAEVRKLEQPAKLATKAARKAEAQRRRKAVTGTPGQRQPRQLDKGYLAFLRRQPCCVGPAGCSGPVQAAHIRFSDFKAGRINPGKGQKSDDRWATSLCAGHHAEQHARGDERAWWDEKGVDPTEESARLYAAYQSEAPE